ncbi:unnamed protein product [Discosporangium mesarthrocarpum]
MRAPWAQGRSPWLTRRGTRSVSPRGMTIKAIREHSGARIEISSHAFQFHNLHGPLPPCTPGGPPMSPQMLMDRVMTVTGSFDACLRAHHLVASKLMEVRPSPLPCPGPGSLGPPGMGAPSMGPSHVGGGSGPGGGPGLGHGGPSVFSFSGTSPTASASPASSVSGQSVHWDYEERAVMSPPSRPVATQGQQQPPPLVGGSGSGSSSGSGSGGGGGGGGVPGGHGGGGLEEGGDGVGGGCADMITSGMMSLAMGGPGERNNGSDGGSGSGGGCGGGNGSSEQGAGAGAGAAPMSPTTITGIDVEIGRAAFALLGVGDLADIKQLSGAGIVAPDSPEYGMAAEAAGAGTGAAAPAATKGVEPPHGQGRDSLLKEGSHLVAAPVVMRKATGDEEEDGGRGLGALGMSEGRAQCRGLDSGRVAESFGVGEGCCSGVGSRARRGRIQEINLRHVGDFSKVGSEVEVGAGNWGGGAGVSSPLKLPSPGAAAAAAAAAAVATGRSGPTRKLRSVRITGTAEEVQLAEYLLRVRTARYLSLDA